MGPLCAASMESGSLHRGYPYLVQLHMLGDIESAAKLCLFQPEQHKLANLDSLINLWQSRLIREFIQFNTMPKICLTSVSGYIHCSILP